jgi:thiol-disulfide isomerase/thioredoxin
MVTRIDKRSLQKLLSGQVKAPTKCLIKFYTSSCHYCNALKPIYEILSEENDNVPFFVFNTMDYPEISNILGFEGVPTLMMLDSGGELPKRRFIKEPVDPHPKTWYTGNNIRDFIGGF